MMAMIVFKGLGDEEASRVTAIVLLVLIAFIPLIYTYVLYKRRSELGKEEMKSKYGSLYKGLTLASLSKQNEEEDTTNYHKVWLFPLFFLVRRSAFIAITVFLFEYPALQMAAHQVITVPYMAYLS